ncbi:uncharacterized protein TrAFT101_005773 [Trichoderma asperellum]|uniref:DUF3752 domain-containing protein n=1 Tax=Trichoderma asperellum (strain ATCC 204424 / CBS 433.97 / NBRC 101777) TaxID=1042311 RepID=A0A2T3Z704_TRIA4|nr:hypothetical protein M441DRAFT_141111 [Trichoderma asperellum CBS 433.97]PTB40597.1 hypothetical protein M441DRAFT_141111 [Trichoderma asperellum CBS 433.97]UKZ90775.1 hypothetical protein TrAFT101_005773 [Trichoderma asperellum]
MSSIGPQLPPHLTKRKHDDDDNVDESTCPSNKHPRRDDNTAQPPQNQDEIDINGSSSDSEDDYGPPRPSTLPAAPAPRSVGPSLPPHLAAAANNEDEINLSDSDSDPLPQPPPAAAAAASNPPNPDPDSDSSDDDDDDDFGPSLPSASAPRARQIGPSLPPSDLDAAPKRDEWMLAPPPSSSTFSERDTTKIRARKFASKPSAASSSASAPGAPSIWTETPEEKLKRLQDSVLGRTSSASSSAEAGGGASELQRKKQLRDEALAADIQARRGKTLLEEHQGAGEKKKKAGAARPEDEEDDPSKRAFDREKDMAVGGRITATQRKELINKSANFGGRFQKGSFL